MFVYCLNWSHSNPVCCTVTKGSLSEPASVFNLVFIVFLSARADVLILESQGAFHSLFQAVQIVLPSEYKHSSITHWLSLIFSENFWIEHFCFANVKKETATSARAVLFAKVTAALGMCLFSCHIELDVMACHYSKLLIRNRIFCLKRSLHVTIKH